MSRMLFLHFPIKGDPKSQGLAAFVKDGFRIESWMALQDSGTVYEARITALVHPDHPAGVTPPLYSSILLSTLYEGPPYPYQQFFWSKLPYFFCAVAFAAKDPPFGLEDLTPPQAAAFEATGVALLAAEAAKTADEIKATQEKLRVAMAALEAALAMDTLDKTKKTKFERFAEWVDRNDLTFNIGSPQGSKGDVAGQDLRIPPVGNQRSQFVNMKLPKAPLA